MYTLFTDSDSDFTLKECQEYGMKMISMPYIVDGKTIKPYEDFTEFDSKTYYDMLRGGKIPTTCGISPTDYINYLEPEFKAGRDVLYVHFSAAMTSTFESLNIALNMLKETYPDRTCYLLDTKGITICSYIITKEVAEMYKKGATIQEILDWGKENVDHFATYFFANDLKFFKKSGRVSGLKAFFGNLVGVRPIINMSQDGKMDSIGTAKGMKNAIKALVNYVDTLGIDLDKHTLIIGNSDALEIANKVETAIREKYPNIKIQYVTVNPTAGAHCGPDGVGVSFFAKNR